MRLLPRLVTRGDRSYWTRIGVAFENAKDGSWSLEFDYLPADVGATTVQLRDFRRTGGDEGESEEGVAAQPF
jgi:hypothetical protein